MLKKEGWREKRKVKVKSQNFDFNTWSILRSRYYASGTEGREVHELSTAFWWDLALYIQAVARKRLDFAAKFPGEKGLIQKHIAHKDIIVPSNCPWVSEDICFGKFRPKKVS